MIAWDRYDKCLFGVRQDQQTRHLLLWGSGKDLVTALKGIFKSRFKSRFKISRGQGTMGFERVMGLHVVDEDGYQRYRQQMEPILISAGGSFGYDFRIAEVLRSKTTSKINRVFTIEFPGKQAMEDFFARPDYLAIRDRYFKAAVADVTVISMHETGS